LIEKEKLKVDREELNAEKARLAALLSEAQNKVCKWKDL
jgi:hypothetical protein